MRPSWFHMTNMANRLRLFYLIFLLICSAKEISAHEAPEIRLHLPHAPLWEPHRARYRSEQRQKHSARGAPAGGRAVARLRAHDPGLWHAVQRAWSPAQNEKKGGLKHNFISCEVTNTLFEVFLGCIKKKSYTRHSFNATFFCKNTELINKKWFWGYSTCGAFFAPGHHAGLLQGGSGALHTCHAGGGASCSPGVAGQGLLRAGLPRDQAADVPHRHASPPGLWAGADQDGWAAAGGGFPGDDQELVLAAHWRAFQRTLQGKDAGLFVSDTHSCLKVAGGLLWRDNTDDSDSSPAGFEGAQFYPR